MRKEQRATVRSVFLLVLGVGAFAIGGRAQTVKPVIVEYTGSAKGKIELVNNGLQPTNVLIEPRSFSITEDGVGVFEPLAKNIHLKLSAMSLRIPPGQGRYVFYEVKADALPAWFVIYSTFAGPTRQAGINIRLDLPHTVYLLQKQPLQRQDVSLESLKYIPSQRQIVVTLVNTSSKLGRVLEWQVGAKATKSSNAGFPLLPQSRRLLVVPWESADPPQTFWVRFAHFSLKEEFSASHN